MTNASPDARFLELFPQWLQSLGEDAAAVGGALASVAKDDDATRLLASGLSYVFKSLDLIPDGVDDLGFLDDAFVLRVACSLARDSRKDLALPAIQRLAHDARAVHDFLGNDFTRLCGYVTGLRTGAARGRSIEEIVTDAETRAAFVDDLKDWAKSYQAPHFTRDPKTLVKLKSYLGAKLP